MSILTVEALGIGFGQDYAVREFDLSVGERDRVGLVGESGCGKTVTALTLAGLRPESAWATGVVRYGDASASRNMLTMSERQLAMLRGGTVVMMPQDPATALDPVKRIGRQMGEVIVRRHRVSRAKARALCLDVLERVGLRRAEERLRSYPHELSGGQRQRVVLAMAISCRPKLIIADEPTTALDVTAQAGIIRLLSQVVAEEGIALLYISHDLSVIAALCQDVMVMYGGRVVEFGRVKRVFEAPRHPYTSGLLTAMPASNFLPGHARGARLLTIPGSVPALGEFPTGCVFRNRCPRATERCIDAPPKSLAPDAYFECWHPIPETE